MLTRRNVLRWTLGMTASLLTSPESITRGSLSRVSYAAESSPSQPGENVPTDPSPTLTKPKNIVICSDGTGNWGGDAHPSNVFQLCDMLSLDDKSVQVAAYDAGVGTDVDQNAIEKLKGGRENLELFNARPIPVAGWFEKQFGLLGGAGLENNLKQLYRYLVNHYEDGDSIYLFGFSRGAFTVRALAGMLRRCGIVKDMSLIDRVHDLCKVHYEAIEDAKQRDSIKQEHERFKQSYGRECTVKFLGIWDTVKSYGYLFPQSRAHVRYNNIVSSVRHALSIDEQRKFFEQTNWGGLDLDPDDTTRECKPPIPEQDVQEVWFAGDHSDIGGGHEDGHNELSKISLHWMVEEAKKACLIVDDCKLKQLGQEVKKLRETFSNGEVAHLIRHNKLEEFAWKIVQNWVFRWDMKNCPLPHTEFSFPWQHEDRRSILKSKRGNTIRLHSTVKEIYDGKELDELLKGVPKDIIHYVD